MKTVFEHIEQVKRKPHHIRKQIAFATAFGGTALVAFVWFASSISSGTFALKVTSFADIAGQGNLQTSGAGGSNAQNIAGVGAALDAKNTSARIEIVDTASSTRRAKKAEQTTIPF